MGKVFREAIEKRKSFLINQLINRGVYEKNDTHLFKLTLSDLEEEYNKFKSKVESVDKGTIILQFWQNNGVFLYFLE